MANKTRQAADRAWQATRKNLIINGNFDVWQRGISLSGFGFLADRWELGADGGGTFTYTQQSFPPGQTDVPNEPSHYARIACTVAQSGGTYNALLQRIEDVRTASGKTVTVSVWARGNAGGEDFTIALAQRFGTGGSPSSSQFYTALATTLTSSWQKYTATYTIPSISGKTLGTNNDSSFELEFLGPINTTHQFDIAQAQVEIGDYATDFEYRPIGEEIALCQRYYCKTYDVDVAPSTITGVAPCTSMATSSGDGVWRFTFPVTMRTSPSMVWYNPVTGSSSTSLRVSSGNHAVTSYQVGTVQASCFNTTGGALSNNGTGRVHCVADAEL